MKKQTTIKDIALKLGVHHTTVSRALHNHPDVNVETRDKILQLAKVLNYSPNAMAIGLRGEGPKVIAISVPDIEVSYFAKSVSIFCQAAQDAGYTVIISQSKESAEQEIKNIEAFLHNRVSGVIASLSKNTVSMEHFDKLIQAGIPVVFFDRVPSSNKYNRIAVDTYSGTKELIVNLISQGKKRFAMHAGYCDVQVFEERKKGLLDALNEHNIGFNSQWIMQGDVDFKEGYKFAQKILTKAIKPDAIICATDQLAFGVMAACKEMNIDIPERISIVGYDNDQAGELIEPKLSSFEHPVNEMCKATFKLLDRLIEDENTSPTTSLYKMNFINRETI